MAAPPAPAQQPAAPAETPNALQQPVQTIAQPPPADPAKPPPPAAVDAKWRPKAVEGLQRDDKVLAQTADRFAKLGLNTDQAQAMVDYADELSKLSEQADKAERKERHAGWWKDLEADKELGGAQFKEHLSLASKAGKALFGEEFAEIEKAGLSNWPPLVRALFRAGSKMSEDTLQDNNRPAPPVPDELARIKAQYPKSPQLWDPNHPEFQGARK